jgi:hypothetical protein
MLIAIKRGGELIRAGALNRRNTVVGTTTLALEQTVSI